MASLDKLIARRDHLLLPGHGGPVKHPLSFMRALKTHRRMRALLTEEQVKRYDELRGHGGDQHQHRKH